MFNSREFHERTDYWCGQGWRNQQGMVKQSGIGKYTLPMPSPRDKRATLLLAHKESLNWANGAAPQEAMALNLYFSKCGPRTSSISNTWKSIRNANSQALPHSTNLETRPPNDFDALKFEDNWLKEPSCSPAVAAGRDRVMGGRCPQIPSALRSLLLPWLDPTRHSWAREPRDLSVDSM